jgi:hypothetical protein
MLRLAADRDLPSRKNELELDSYPQDLSKSAAKSMDTHLPVIGCVPFRGAYHQSNERLGRFVGVTFNGKAHYGRD